MKKILLTFDIEDWFQVENLKGKIKRSDWDYKKLRVKNNTNRILNLLEQYNQSATFFVLGWIAERIPETIEKIHAKGHEIASHGYGHDLIYNLSKKEFRNDVKKSKNILEAIIGENIYGYRAPSFSITEWAIEILKKEGFLYDSSFFPTSFHDRYSKLKLYINKGHYIQKLYNDLYEIPISTFEYFGKKFPIGGGGYFRIFPYFLYKKMFSFSIKQNHGGIFYLHPWEIDFNQPKIDKLKLGYKFRHYYGQKTCLTKLEKLLKDFNFCSIINGIIKKKS